MHTDARLCRLCSEVTPQAAVPPGRGAELAPQYEWQGQWNERRVIQIWICLSCLTCNVEIYPLKPYPEDLRRLCLGPERGKGCSESPDKSPAAPS